METYQTFYPAKGKRVGSLLLVHGAGEHIGRYAWAIKQWNLVGYDVFGGDLPGYGRSDGKKGHIDHFGQYVAAVDCWYHELSARSSDVPYIFGHSLGGLVVARFLKMYKRPVQGVILSSPCFGLKLKVPVWKQRIAEALNVICPSLTLKTEIEPQLVTRSVHMIMKDKTDPYIINGASVRWYKELELHMRLNWYEIEDFPDIPLLIHQGGNDKITDKSQARNWIEKLPVNNKIYREWPELYHEVLNEPERDQVIREMITWMKGKV